MRGLPLLSLLSCTLPLYACATGYVATERGPQAYYQTGYPIRDTSLELEKIFQAVKRVQVTGSYHTYRFQLDDSIRLADTRQRATYQRAIEDYSFDHSKAGTATIVNVSGGRALLVTAEHIISLPDTVVVYYRLRTEAGPVGVASPYVESVSIRTNQRYLVLGLPTIEPFTIVAADTANDVVAIAVLFDRAEEAAALQVLPIPAGDPSKLVWGSFVYVLGYPRGFRMVTRGIVSDPNRTADHSFLLDGLFNRGISGGLIVAVRGDSNELEWVGLATAASADIEYRLTPERRIIEDEDLLVPYQGRLYLERLSRIDYGVTFSVPGTAVLRLLRQARVPVDVSGGGEER